MILKDLVVSKLQVEQVRLIRGLVVEADWLCTIRLPSTGLDNWTQEEVQVLQETEEQGLFILRFDTQLTFSLHCVYRVVYRNNVALIE